jgi:ATP-dependent helicase/nuclease subunit A
MIRDPATQRQVDAADPLRSTWLSANAGSGKTRVLTDRVARLLLEGVDPQNILCLTYTKAAASEMQNRLFRRLGGWAMMETERLRQELRDLGSEGPLDSRRLRQSRTLFALAMETPGGLKVQTIHSFCAGLLRRFPLEAGVSPQFTEIEDRAAELLRTEVVDMIAAGPRAAAVANLARHFTGESFDTLLREIASERAALGVAPTDQDLRMAFGLAPGVTAAGILDQVLSPASLAMIRELAALCRQGSTNDQKAANRLSQLARGTSAGLADMEILEDVFLTGEAAKQPFSSKAGAFPTKATRAKASALMAEVDALIETVAALRPDRLALVAFERTRTLIDFADVFVPAYELAKQQRGLLDFDDLISKAKALLTDPQVAQWVLFRLDGGIDHILVDEAQDTSPDQWAVIQKLAQEFAAGQGARPDSERTIFVVGDKKQSIYSFQGADPEEFDRMRRHFEAALAPVGRPLQTLTLDHSFRSAAAILRIVDLVFKGPHLEGLGPEEPFHIAFKDAMPGRVDLWPPVPATREDKEDRDWTDPVDQVSDRHHNVILAEMIAGRVAEMVKTGSIPCVAADGAGYAQRPISEGDILILVQRRSELFNEIIRGLKIRNLRVAGADRLRVGAEMAVRDIGAVLRFLALPEDDLSLASALRSPLFGWTEQQLYTLAHHRPDHSFLWEALRNADHAETLAILEDLRNEADFLRPYDLINRILTRHDGRKRLLARLGTEAEDGIDALLSQALAYEQNAVPGLTGFVEWMETDSIEIKRQLDAADDRIRVMTIHGAKGLESPIVILPDTAKRPVRIRESVLKAGPHRFWAPNVPQMPPVMKVIRDQMIAAQERERRRLLYVAMTRAESWLIVCAAGETGQAGDSWHAMVHDGMVQAGAETHRFGETDGLRFGSADWSDLPMSSATLRQPPAVVDVDFPILPARDAAASPVISPSELGGAKVMPGDPTGGDAEASIMKGNLIHLLLEHLPAVAPDRRRDHARSILELAEDIGTAGDVTDVIEDAIRILGSPDLERVFGAGGLTEVGVTATISQLGNRRFHGSVDRLIVRPDHILAIDFKSNRIVPPDPAGIPEGILRQMGAYQAMLMEIYADRPVEVMILWTATATLMPVPPSLSMAALQRSTIP